MHPLTAQLVDADADSATLIRDALADAGCLDIVTTVHALSCGTDPEATPPELVVICVQDGNVASLHRLVAAQREVPVIAVCDEDDIDMAFAAGAVQCVTRPVRRRELLGRIRDAMRIRTLERRRAQRERKMSDAIVALKQEKQDLERLVCVDPLTGIANRRHAMAMLEGEWKRSARDQSPLALIMIDLDCFHNYNEQYGHLGGDACLQQVVDAMVRALRRPSDYLGRYGGEEFMAVLPNTDSVGAKIVAERLRAAVEALAIPHSASVCGHVVTITVGFAAIRVLANDSIDRLVAAADAALLRAKRDGRNRVGGEAPLVRPSRVSAQRWERYQPVYADPWYADRIPQFLETVTNDVRQMVETSREGERRSGLPLQRLRVTAEQVGLATAALLIRDLEIATREGEAARMREAAEELIQYVTHVQVVYRRPTQPPVLQPLQLAQAG